MHSNCRLSPEDIVCKITQRNNIRKANTCDPVLKLLYEEITSDIQKHKQTHGRSIWTLTGTTGTTHTFYGRPYMVYPIEHLQPHTTTPSPLFIKQFTNSVKHATHKTNRSFNKQDKTYKDTKSHSPLLRSKKHKNNAKITTNNVLTN